MYIALSALTNSSNSNHQASNRISFDIGSYQLNKSKLKSNSKRVVSDSSLYSNSRPTSMIIDSDATFIPPYSIHNNSNSNLGNNHNNKTTSSNLYGSIYPNRLSKSTISLNTAIDSDYFTRGNDVKRSSSLLHAKNSNHGSHHNHHSHRHDHSSRKKTQKRTGNNQGIVSADIDRWSSDTSSNILFAIIFHILNIFFSVCIYLPIYILVKLGYVSFLLIGLAILAWYVYGGSPTSAVVVNLQHTISEI